MVMGTSASGVEDSWASSALISAGVWTQEPGGVQVWEVALGSCKMKGRAAAYWKAWLEIWWQGCILSLLYCHSFSFQRAAQFWFLLEWLLATAKEQIKSTSKRQAECIGRRETRTSLGLYCNGTQTYIQVKTQPVQTEVNNRLCLVSMAKAVSKYAEADL
jgi:hypothetical protein